ncbi:MAG: CRISPR-associated helicase Cas3', partial [Gammaproteobacteria bacterium]|nr:CRISPR-associated helicase Cas3' [Gammaproteobacteria bacterium]
RAFGVRKSVLIIDEVHAYDAYMHGLLSKVLEAQRQAGGSAVLLSATLPSGIREKLLSAWRSRVEPENPKNYPLISHAGNTPATLTLPPPEKPERTVCFTLQASPTMEASGELLGEAVRLAARGAKIALICNLVDDAQRTWERLTRLSESEKIPIDLFHARFQFVDRQKRENEVIHHYGKNAPQGGRILAATQVI